MRKAILVAALACAVAGVSLAARAQPYGGYGPGPGPGPAGASDPGWMQGDDGPGPDRMQPDGYRPMGGDRGDGMMGGDGDDRGHGMSGGYGGDPGYGRGQAYRGDRLCWRETDSARGYGYYAPCER